MPVEIASASYGKQLVRVLTWTATAGPHEVRDLTLSLEVAGALEDSYRRGDNAAVLPSDSLRRHAVAELAEHPARTADEQLSAIGARILGAAPALGSVIVDAESQAWQRIGAHTFTAGGRLQTAVGVHRAGGHATTGRIRGLQVLMTTGSSFTGFLRDELTTQAEAANRPLLGELDAEWTSGADPAAPDKILAVLLRTLADRPSNAVQQLLTEVGTGLLDACPSLATLRLHLASLPLSALGDGTGCEVGTGPVGVTTVSLNRTA
ncbi:MAG: urate oxidase [Frankiales bacterium]|nr:urate oxidase [Frankiales bacterium]